MRCHQREPAKLAIRIERFFNSIFLKRQKNICIFGNYHLLYLRVLSPLFSVSSIIIFFYVPQKSPRATFCQFCSHLSLFLLDSTWNLLRDELKKKKKRLSSSAGSFFLPASAGGFTAKQRYLQLAQVSLLADWFIVYLAIVVTYSHSFTTFQTEYFWSSLGNCVEY